MTRTDDAAEPTTIECSLTLSGRDFDPEAVSRALELEATKIWRQKRPALAARTDLANTAWCFDVGSACWTSFDEAISALLTAIGAASARVAPCARAMGLKVCVVCVAFIYQDRPAYFVTPATLQALTNLEAELSFEIFDRRDLD